MIRGAGYRERLGLVVVAVAAVLLYWAFMHHLPFLGGPDGKVVRAEVRSAANVNPRTPVRVGGTDVGKVERLEPAAGGRRSTIVMRITEPGVEVHADARADIRFRTLLGGSMYVALDPGSASAPELGDRTIALARTTAQVDWDEFNLVFAKPVPQGERRIVKGFADALEDPAPLREILREAGPALRSFGRAADAGRGQRDGELTSLIRRAARATRGFAADGSSLSVLIRGAQRTARATARVDAALGESIDRLPVALRAARPALARLDRTLTHADPVIEELIPPARLSAATSRKLRPALVGLDRLLRRATPLLDAAPPTLDSLRATTRDGLPFVAALGDASQRLVDDVLPWMNTVDPKTRLKLFQAIGPWLSGQNDSYSNFDDNGYFLRGTINQGPDSAQLPCTTSSPADAQNCAIVRRVFRQALRGGR